LILKEEIKNNLQKLKINKEDLYIYIRAGDSFRTHGNVLLLLIVFIKKLSTILNLIIFL
jgi:hypothetical protein